MTRRALFVALASLPFVGRFVKRPACDGFTGDTDAVQEMIYASSLSAAYRIMLGDGSVKRMTISHENGIPARLSYVRGDSTAVTIAIPVRRL